MKGKLTNGRLAARSGVFALALLGLGACVTGGDTVSYEGIGFREARFNEIEAMRSYRQCRDEGVALDELARQEGSRGRYLASARLLEKCEAELGPEGRGIAVDERMRAYALGIQNYFKAGDLEKARENLARFQQAFPENDLYYVDGSSFTATMALLFERHDTDGEAAMALRNVNDALKDEVRRIAYWRRK